MESFAFTTNITVPYQGRTEVAGTFFEIIATISTVNDHLSDLLNPVNGQTLMESTSRYDGRGRIVASTVWLSARGAIDRSNPPIAGLDGVSLSDGLTTQYLYDDNLSDTSGLNSTGGVAPLITIPSKVTSNIKLSTALTKLAAAENAGGAGITFAADAPGRAVVVISPTGEISFTISDALGRTVMSGRLDNDAGTPGALLTWSCTRHDTTSELSGFGTVLETRSIDALGKVTKTLTDGAGRTLRSIDQLGKVTQFTYDASGNQLSIRDPNSVGVDMVYDSLGRVTSTTDTADHTTTSTYDKAGNRLTAKDAKNETTTYVYDARGRQLSQTDRLGGATVFTYLPTGQLATLTDAENQTTTYTYDDAGFKLTEQYPDHTSGSSVGTSGYGIVTFTPDAAGRVLVKQDQAGDTCTYNYDLAGRLSSRDYRILANSPTGTKADSDTFTYDNSGRMLTAVSGRYSNTVTYTYDTAGRKKTEKLTISGQDYTTQLGYNSRGELTNYDYPDGAVVEREYTDRGELHKIKHNTTVIDTRVYDDGGRMTSSSYNNGVGETRGYNDDNTLASITFSGASIGNMTYSWDENKNKTAEAITGTMDDYGFTIPAGGYDKEDRLVSYNRASGLNQSWSLSEVGDWDSVTTNSSTQTRTHGPAHELLTGASQNVTSDVKGNMTLIPAALRANSSSLGLSWDFDNRMASADVGNNSSIEVSHSYDALGRRVARTEGSTTTVFVQVGHQTIADYPAGATAAQSTYRYLYASYIDEPVMRWQTSNSARVYFHRNQQYSVIALTDDAGAIAERYSYTAYGEPAFFDGPGSVISNSQIANRYTYTGREYDPTIRLYHYRARMYDSLLGRFLGRDPIGYADTMNQFEYSGGKPMFIIDPFGLCGSFPSGDARCNNGGCAAGRGNITVDLTKDVGYYESLYHYAAIVGVSFRHIDSQFRKPDCGCCCCEIGFAQKIISYDYFWSGDHQYSNSRPDGGFPYRYTISTSVPCERYAPGTNQALMGDNPGIHYNSIQYHFWGHPRYLRVKGVTCAICIRGEEGYKTRSTPGGHYSETYLTSLTIYDCVEWEFTLRSRREGYPNPEKAKFTSSTRAIGCNQHHLFLGRIR